MNIKKQDFIFNATVCNEGRLVELEECKLKIKNKQQGWKSFLNPFYHIRLQKLYDNISKHQQWLVNKKYVNMPKMYFYKIDDGWILLPWNFYKG